VNYNETYHICVGTIHKETHSKLLKNTGQGDKGKEVQGRGYIDLRTIRLQVKCQSKNPTEQRTDT
jgi:hypothetical protein